MASSTSPCSNLVLVSSTRCRSVPALHRLGILTLVHPLGEERREDEADDGRDEAGDRDLVEDVTVDADGLDRRRNEGGFIAFTTDGGQLGDRAGEVLRERRCE